MSKMFRLCGLLCSYAAVFAVAISVDVVEGSILNVSEPDRQTHIYGTEFFVVLPLLGGIPEKESCLQIACFSCDSSSQANGNIAFLGRNHSESFTASPTLTFFLDRFAPFPAANESTAVLNVTSDYNVTVTVIIQISGTIGAYTAIPLASLDTYYAVASYGLQEDNLSELTVVAVSQDTNESFKPNARNVTTPADKSSAPPESSHLLKTGESVVYQTAENFIGGHLQGDLHPLSGIVGSRCSTMGDGCPRSLEQLYPLVSLGTRYTAVSVGDRNLTDIFRAVAVWNNTTITWSKKSDNGSWTLNNGETTDISLENADSAIIHGSKPFLLIHHHKQGTSTGDIALVTVPPEEQMTSDTITFATPNQSVSYLSIITPCKYIDSIELRVWQGASLSINSYNQPPQGAMVEDETEKMCSCNQLIEPGNYTLGPAANFSEAVYSALLYGSRDSAVFAYILATELRQVVCGVEKGSKDVILCPSFVSTPETTTDGPTGRPTDGPTGRPTDGPTEGPTEGPTATTEKSKVEGISTLLALFIAILSIFAGAVVVGIVLVYYCRKRKWKRLDESEYNEEHPIRLHILENSQANL